MRYFTNQRSSCVHREDCPYRGFVELRADLASLNAASIHLGKRPRVLFNYADPSRVCSWCEAREQCE